MWRRFKPDTPEDLEKKLKLTREVFQKNGKVCNTKKSWTGDLLIEANGGEDEYRIKKLHTFKPAIHMYTFWHWKKTTEYHKTLDIVHIMKRLGQTFRTHLSTHS
jgi:hypothetical protein